MKAYAHYGISFMLVLFSVAVATLDAGALTGSPASLTFTAAQGASSPSSQTVVFSKGNKRQVVAWASSDNALWLSVTPTSGTIAQSDQIVVTANTSGLAAGVYSAMVIITAKKGGSLSIPVTLSVTGPSSTPSQPSPSVSTTATLTWSPNTEPDVAGFKVYIGNAPGVYGSPIVLGNVTTYVASNLALGKTYYFAVSAFDTSGNESPLSAVVSKSVY